MHRLRLTTLPTRALRALANRPRTMLGVAMAVLAAGGAMSVAAALVPEASTNSLVGSSAVSASSVASTSTVTASSTSGTASASTPNTSEGGGEGDSNNGESTGGNTLGAAALAGIASATAGATGTQSASGASAAAHTNGHGCDDIIHAEDRTPAPGGPVGCEVGNSGEHRQNGKTATATATGTATATPSGTAAASPAGASDPHANGHGCDDVNPAVIDHQPSHGGPVGCTVGNSGDHRQNGAGAATSTATASGTAAASTTGTPVPHGNSGQNGKNK